MQSTLHHARTKPFLIFHGTSAGIVDRHRCPVTFWQPLQRLFLYRWKKHKKPFLFWELCKHSNQNFGLPLLWQDSSWYPALLTHFPLHRHSSSSFWRAGWWLHFCRWWQWTVMVRLTSYLERFAEIEYGKRLDWTSHCLHRSHLVHGTKRDRRKQWCFFFFCKKRETEA